MRDAFVHRARLASGAVLTLDLPIHYL